MEIKVNFKNDLKRNELYKIAEDKNTINLAGFKSPSMKKKEAMLLKAQNFILNFSFKAFKITFAIFILLFIIFLFKTKIFADFDESEDLGLYLKEKCYNHTLAKEFSHGKYNGDNAKRCSLIGMAQMGFETKFCKIGTGKIYNNCFGFRQGGFIKFKTKKESIDFYVNHYYKYQRFKTIKQITMDSYYCSPITGWCGWIKGFTYTKGEQKPYYYYVKAYFTKNF